MTVGRLPGECMIHNRWEPDLPGDYRACGECLHVWRTAVEFVGDCARWGPVPDDLATVASCPLCAHDF